MPNDNDIIEGIASHDNSTLTHVYEEMYPYVEAYVVHHGGTEDHARDIFQEAMIIVYKKITEGNFTLKCKFNTYLYAVCKRLWIQDRKKHYLRINLLKEMPSVFDSETDYSKMTVDETRELFDKHFNNLSPDCQQILKMYFNGLSLEEIRVAMGINTAHHTSDKKYRCRKTLIERIQADPTFIKQKNG
ncbi:MAG: sigma-70 family RNA polymerase sigma factor [Bacteroidales bacterium]